MEPVIAILAWLWMNFSVDAIKKAVPLLWNVIKWHRAVKQYQSKIERDYGSLPLFGRHSRVDIDDFYIYSEVKSTNGTGFSHDEANAKRDFIQRRSMHDSNRRPAWPMIAVGKNIFVFGGPGSGKTAFLRMAILKAARGHLRLTNGSPSRIPIFGGRIPIFLNLGDHIKGQRSLYDSIRNELDVYGFPNVDLFMNYAFGSGRALLLWDALDEVAAIDGRRISLIVEMRDFIRKYDRCQYVISCRSGITEYRKLQDLDIDFVNIAPFSDKQIKRYLDNWFGENSALSARCYTELQSQRHIALRELASTPILLTLLTIVYEKKDVFPSRRVDIYYQAIEALLGSWDTERSVDRGAEVYEELELGYKWDMMIKIAAEAFYNGEYLLTRQEWSMRIRKFLVALPEISGGVDGGLVFDAMVERHGLFVRQPPDMYSLPHLSFQEYFTARDIKNSIQDRGLDHLLDHIDDDRWREVFLMTAAQLEQKDAEYFFELFLRQLDQMVVSVPPIQSLLRWAQVEANRIGMALNLGYPTVSLRAGYHACAIEAVYDWAIMGSGALAHLLHQAQNRVDEILYLTNAEFLDLDAIHDKEYLLRECEEWGFDDLYYDLEQLAIPQKGTAQQDWVDFREELSVVISKYNAWTRPNGMELAEERDNERYQERFASFQLNEQQITQYIRYLNGIGILIDCQKSASVSDILVSENRLLLPSI